MSNSQESNKKTILTHWQGGTSRGNRLNLSARLHWIGQEIWRGANSFKARTQYIFCGTKGQETQYILEILVNAVKTSNRDRFWDSRTKNVP